MKKHLYLGCIVFFFFSLAGSGELTNGKTLARFNNLFAARLYNQIKIGDNANICLSPFSIFSCMAIAYGGANDITAEEIAGALNLPIGDEIIHSWFKELNTITIENSIKSGQKISVVNGLCLTDGDVSREYKTLLKEKYDADIFRGDLAEINNWVRNKTDGKVEKILSELPRNSVCVLLNAIYLKGLWEKAFEKKKTQKADFRTANGGVVNALMMYQKNNFRFLQKPEYKILELPYKKEAFSMIIFLPEKVDGLAEMENSLFKEGIMPVIDEINSAHKCEVSVFLPKFKMEMSYDLIEPFKKMGVKEAFGNSADFSKMGWKKGEIFIAQIKHKTFIDVDEEGTEAAAATGVAFGLTSFAPPLIFRADHPFLFLIKENETGNILFIGRVCIPSA